MRLVSVVTSTRSLRSARTRISSSRSSTCPFTGRTSICGSTRPVGRITCSTTTPPDLRQLVRPGRRGNVDDLIGAMLELLEIQRAVVERRGHAEAVVHERLLARAVAVIHAAQLRNGLVRFVDEQQIILRNVIEQRGRRFAGQAAGHVPRIIFDAVAIADGAHHFDVEHACAATRAALRRYFPCFSSSGFHQSSSSRIVWMARSLCSAGIT